MPRYMPQKGDFVDYGTHAEREQFLLDALTAIEGQECAVRPLVAEHLVLGVLMDIFRWRVYLTRRAIPQPHQR